MVPVKRCCLGFQQWASLAEPGGQAELWDLVWGPLFPYLPTNPCSLCPGFLSLHSRPGSPAHATTPSYPCSPLALPE
ncbi:hypothetical protein EYF80_027196 [Liparis tanakae]|uniref:Uncharacterized protein n=1 Tax=Liparis tanakae TaxID=230148 RepID=A0A4Z2H9M1_9TELE|nr:hypothetical protein EYF80_027196 [Liparis tanakae]